ncbi:MAG: TonB-dependent receptor [Arenicella sp.]|nr:TonB-dependent receptor [Arenicella sp.]
MRKFKNNVGGFSFTLIAMVAAMPLQLNAQSLNNTDNTLEENTDNTSDAIALEEIVVTGIGSRNKERSASDLAVPVDVISTKDLERTNQVDIGQSLHFSAPSFNAVKFGINDLAPLVDPASLRGLGPDQTLLLVNGKRRHKVAFFSLNHGVGKGQLGNDINAIPSAAIKNVEILRDGAAAQYGSDAIAGVVNLSLKDASSGGSARIYTGTSYTKPKFDGISSAGANGESIYGGGSISDGDTFSISANFGLGWGDDGFINTTVWRHKNDSYDRSGTYTHSAGWYPDDPALTQAQNEAEDTRLRELNGIDLDRAVLGGAENTNYGVFVNAGRPINDNWDFYAFGGYSEKEVIGGIFSRAAARDDRSALGIFPNGFNPETPSELNDYQIVAGARGELVNGWGLDVSAGYSGNELDLFARNTVNPSLGNASPTEFFTGALEVTQTILNADLTMPLGSDGNTTLALGTELRYETFQQTPGDLASYIAGPLAGAGGKDVGSTGREGYSDITGGDWSRNNVGVYAEIERDFSENFLVSGAIRAENYSDFGSDTSFKLASRYRFSEGFALRGSFSQSFRAPALAQTHYSNFAQIAFNNEGDSVVTPFLPIRDSRVQSAFGISELKPETSRDFALGFTAQPTENLSLTVDLYQIKLKDRIIVSGGITAADFSQFADTNFNEINIFTNAVDTTTKGIDIVANYDMEFDSGNALTLSFAANFNDTKVDAFNIPAAFGDSDIIDDRDIVFLTDGVPNQKIIVTADYNVGMFDLLARATNFGEVQDSRETDPATGGAQVFASKTLVDLSATARINDHLDISLGINNVFDEYPDLLITPNVRGEVLYSRRTNQFGTLGRFASFTVNYNW